MRTSEMNENTNYLLCPDRDCELFQDDTGIIPCEDRCPHQDKLVKIIICRCGEMIQLPGNYSLLRSASHLCKSGARPAIFRAGLEYIRIFEMPEDDREADDE